MDGLHYTYTVRRTDTAELQGAERQSSIFELIENITKNGNTNTKGW